MKRIAILFAACTICAELAAAPRAEIKDTTAFEQLYEAVVSATRAPQSAPFAISRIQSSELREFSQGVQELPFLFAHTPGVVAWSDNGLGTGTSYLRIRGAGDSRINVTIDGVPLNSPEDQCVFWANMNSYSSFLGGVEIQRGVGSSSNGDGAFGGTVALSSRTPSLVPSAQVDFSYGSYNTRKAGASLSTGLLGGKWIIDASYHNTATDGYMAGTAGNSGSWMGSVTLLANPDLLFRYHNIGNYEHTGQAWSGVNAAELLDGTYGMQTGIFGYEDLDRVGLGRYNCLAQWYEKNDDGTYTLHNYEDPIRGGNWSTTDNFVQDHNILSVSWQASEEWSLSAALHYTWGSGYYEELKPDTKLSKFGLSSFIDKDGNQVKKTDFIRQKGLTQHTYGLIANARRQSEKFDLRFGLSAQNFNGWHYGYLSYIKNEELLNNLKETQADKFANGNYLYYDSDAVKTDLSGFVKATYTLCDGLKAFADLQYRFVRYTTGGINDKFYENEDGSFTNQSLDINKTYNFFNPKGGFEYTSGAHKAFASVALSHREPERNNFTDNGSYPAPEAEKLVDYELGYNYGGKALQLGVTLYYMDYHNQFVFTGAQSDIGEALTTNIAKSYRAGVELAADLRVCSWLDLSADAALSSNRILDFDEVVDDWDNGSQTIHYDNSALAFSPSAILGGGFTLHKGGARLNWRTSYVSRQYLDNTECEQRSLPGYTNTDVNLSYTFTPKRNILWFRDITVGLNLGNIFNSRYAANAWVYSAIYESGGHTNDKRYTEIGYFPAAGFTALGTCTIRF